MLVTLCKKSVGWQDSNPQYQFLTNGYCLLLCDHQPTSTCFTLQNKQQVVPNRGTALFFYGLYKSSSLFLRLITPFSFAICEMFCLSSENQVTSCTEPAA